MSRALFPRWKAGVTFYFYSILFLTQLCKSCWRLSLQLPCKTEHQVLSRHTYKLFADGANGQNCISLPLYQIEVLLSLSTLPSCCKQHGRHLISTAVPDRFFKRHGGWKSEATKDSYLKECFLTYNSPDLLDCKSIIQLHSMLWPSRRVLWRLVIQTIHFVRREMMVLAGGAQRQRREASSRSYKMLIQHCTYPVRCLRTVCLIPAACAAEQPVEFSSINTWFSLVSRVACCGGWQSKPYTLWGEKTCFQKFL